MTHFPIKFHLIALAFSLLQSLPFGHAQLHVPPNIQYKWHTDTSIKTVELNEFTFMLSQHAMVKLDFPKFVGMSDGMQEWFIHEPVIAVNLNGEAKAYPLNMLTMHEISNDSCGGVPILVTFCALCNSSVVFNRRVVKDNQPMLLNFEVSGMLRHSDMVMIDVQTETWWQQLMGEAMVGKLAGTELEMISSMVITVGEFFHRFPNGKIVEHHTGSELERLYGHNQHVHYDSIGHKPFGEYFDPNDVSNRLDAMERVVAIKGSKDYKIYPLKTIAEEGVINDVFDNRKVVVFYESGLVSVLDEEDIRQSKMIGTATLFSPVLNGRHLTFKKVNNVFVDQETGSKWDITGLCEEGELKGKSLYVMNHTSHFAFAWLSFYPNSVIYGEE